MKIKIKSRIRKPLLTMVSFVAIFVLSVFFQGCEQENIFENSSYSDYLELESYVFSNMSKTDWNKLGQAMQRLEIYKKDGIYLIKQTSGMQVNIAEELFNNIKNSINQTNKIFKSYSLNSSIPRLKSGGTEEPLKTDCVAWSLFGMGGVTYSAANAWLVTAFGPGGVPAAYMDSAVYNFYPNASNNLTQGPMNNALIYFSTSDTTGHAVNGIFYDSSSGWILYKDNQNNVNGYILAKDIFKVYYP